MEQEYSCFMSISKRRIQSEKNAPHDNVYTRYTYNRRRVMGSTRNWIIFRNIFWNFLYVKREHSIWIKQQAMNAYCVITIILVDLLGERTIYIRMLLRSWTTHCNYACSQNVIRKKRQTTGVKAWHGIRKKTRAHRIVGILLIKYGKVQSTKSTPLSCHAHVCGSITSIHLIH